MHSADKDDDLDDSLVVFDGKRMTTSAACRHIGCHPQSVANRMKLHGETRQQAIDHFVRKYGIVFQPPMQKWPLQPYKPYPEPLER